MLKNTEILGEKLIIAVKFQLFGKKVEKNL